MNATKHNENPNTIIARELSHKYEYYLLALIFTVLGLSVQTMMFYREYCQYLIEVSALLSLIVSGLIGFWRIEFVTMGYFYAGQDDSNKEMMQRLNKCIEYNIRPKDEYDNEYSTAEIEKMHEDCLSADKAFEKKMKQSNKAAVILYKIEKWVLVIGLILLVLSRIMAGFIKMNDLEVSEKKQIESELSLVKHPVEIKAKIQ